MKRVLQIAALFFFFLGCVGYSANAQRVCSEFVATTCYEDNINGIFATSGSRVVATIKEEVNDVVQVQCAVIGYIKLGAATLSLKYDHTKVYPIDGPGGSAISTNLNSLTELGNYLSINPELPGSPNNWKDGSTGQINPQIMGGDQYWTYIRCGQVEEEDVLENEEGEMVWMFSIFFKKIAPETAITNTTFQYYHRVAPPFLHNEVVSGSTYVRSEGEPSIAVYVNDNVFTRRVPAVIESQPATLVCSATATLEAVAKIANTGIEPIIGGKGLDWDNIKKAGFIYCINNTNVYIKEYVNDSIFINGTLYPFALSNLSHGNTFTVGGQTFKVVEFSTATYPIINMSAPITGLTPETQYSAYPFLVYNFQTSSDYPVLGNKISFITEATLATPEVYATNNNDLCDDANVMLYVANTTSH